MEIKILKKEYIKSSKLYEDFLNDKINDNEDNFTKETVELKETDDFHFYLNETSERKREGMYLEGFKAVSKIISETERKIHFEGEFWYSYIITQKRNYILENYPQVYESEKNFRNIVLKKFDWENYIYKMLLGAQYVIDNVSEEKDQDRYFKLIANNLDIYNYIIKSEIFRNDKFLLNILDIIDKNNLSEKCKGKIKFYRHQGKDERFGRKVIFELNKSYPMILSPMMTMEELEPLFIENLNKYLNLDNIQPASEKNKIKKWRLPWQK